MPAEMSLRTVFLVLIFLAALFEAGGDIILKKWALDGNYYVFVLGLVVYLIATVIWAFSLKYEFLSKAISVITIINLIVVAAVGVLYFKEDLSDINKWGILLGVVSVIMIEA